MTRALALLALLPGAALADASVRDAVSAVGMYTTPGKPMQLERDGEPAEKIVVRHDGKQARITVTRNVVRFEESSAVLSGAEWQALLALVAAQKVISWRAKESGVSAFDHSTTGVFVLGAGGKELNRQTWSNPIGDAGPPAVLASALARLAQAHVKAPQLHYLVP